MRIREKLSYANVMSTIAIFGVLAGGGAYAATKIGTRDLKRNAVTSAKIANRTIQGNDVRRGAIGRRQLRGSALSRVSAVNRMLPPCDLGSTFADCGGLEPTLGRPGSIVAFVSGGQFAAEGQVDVGCRVILDGGLLGVLPPTSSDSDSSGPARTQGFSGSFQSSTVGRGPHQIRLECAANGQGQAVVDHVTMTAIAIPRI